MTNLDFIKFMIERTEKELSSIQKELSNLKDLEIEKKEYLKTLYEQKRLAVEDEYLIEMSDAAVNKYSTEFERIELFRSFFKGRGDFFSRRFESKRTDWKG